MTSKPLFIIVAESMVMRSPMRQFGCASACSGVTLCSAASGVVRNGPLEAVSTGRRTSPCSPPRKHWWTALCSLSTGSSSRPALFAAAITNSPAATSTSLFESATVLPSFTASYVASKPTTPTAAEMTISAFECVPTASIPSRPWWIAGRGEMPFPRSSTASSSAFLASLTDTTSGLCRSICPASSSRFPPAASATTPNVPARDSTTDRHCFPIEPVDPNMASCFTELLIPLLSMVTLAGLRLGRIDPDPIIPDNRNRKDQRVDAVKDAAMTGQQASRILDPRTTLVRRFQKIAHLPRHVSHCSHPQKVLQRSVDPTHKNERDDQRAKETRYRPFPRFLWAQMRRKGMLADRSAHKIRGRITYPRDHQRKKQQQRALRGQAVEPDRIRQRKRHKNQPAGADSRRGQRFHHRPLGE